MADNFEARARRGTSQLLNESKTVLEQALKERGPEAVAGFDDTAYYLPTILAITGQPITKIKGLQDALGRAEALLNARGAAAEWNQSGNKLLDAGMAGLLAAETTAALQFPGSQRPGNPVAEDDGSRHWIDDVTMRSWGSAVLRGQIPGFALVLGRAQSTKAAEGIAEELKRRNITCFLTDRQDGAGFAQQLQHEGMNPGLGRQMLVLRGDSSAAVHVLGLLGRVAMGFGDIRPGSAGQMLRYCRKLLPGFVLALEDVDEAGYSIAAGAMNFGLPVIAGTALFGDSSTPQVFSAPFDRAGGHDDQARARSLIKAGIEISRMRVQDSGVRLPVDYGPGFGSEAADPSDVRVEFGGGRSRAFELVEAAPVEDVTDGTVELVGSDLEAPAGIGPFDLGLVVRVAGHAMQPEFEPVLEERIQEFVNEARGIQYVGHRDSVVLRVTERAMTSGFNLEWIGKILKTRLHEEYGSVLDKVQVRILADPREQAEGLSRARAIYARRDEERARLTDANVDEFYACTRCQSLEPGHACLISPERDGACGAHNWLSCRAMATMNPGGPHQPVKRGQALDGERGYWAGINAYVANRTQGKVDQVGMHSLMENPLPACGCLECVAMLIPEISGVMVVSREDRSLTPAGMDFEALAELAGSGRQIPGVMGMARSYLVSPRFINGDGGFKRVVWISAELKETMSDQLLAASERVGDPDLISKIADGRSANTVQQLQDWLQSHNHPVVSLEPMF